MLYNHWANGDKLDIRGIEKGEGSVYDKLSLFNDFKDDEQYLYFDLDVIIKGDVSHLFRKKFTLLHAWWRKPAHTPLNSSIMSWYGDHSYIYDKFYKDEDYNRVKYWRGIDEFFYKEINYEIYDKVCWSWMFDNRELDYPVCLFNQSHDKILNSEWTKKYLKI